MPADHEILRLPKPVAFAGQEYTELHLREPTAREVRGLLGRQPTEGAVHLVFDVSGVPIGAIEQLPMSVMRKARDYLQAMCADAPTPDPLPEELTISLRNSVTYADDTLFALHLREPTVGEYKKTDGRFGLDVIITLVAAITGAPVEAIERVGIRDLKAAEAFLLPFI